MVRDVGIVAKLKQIKTQQAGAGTGGGGHSLVTKGAGSINQEVENDGTDETLCINSGTRCRWYCGKWLPTIRQDILHVERRRWRY